MVRRIRSSRAPKWRSGLIRPIAVVLLANLVIAGGFSAVPASAQEHLVVTEADTDAAPTFEPTVSFLLEADVNPYFYAAHFNSGPDMSSDGRWVVYPNLTPDGPRLFRLDLRTGNSIRISGGKEGSAPHVSDDGRRVVFESYGDAGNEIWLWEANGGAPIPLSAPGDNPSFATISDNGSTVSWTANEADGEAETVVWSNGSRRSWPSVGSAPHVSADGRFLFYYSSPGVVVRRNLSTGEVRETPGYAPNAFGVEADRATSDDGTLIATSGPYRNDYLLGSAVTVSTVGGANHLTVRHPLMTSSFGLPPAFLSGDGSTLILTSSDPSAEPGPGKSLYVVDVATGATRRAVVPIGNEAFTISDDGTKVLLHSTIDFESYQLWMVDLDPVATPLVLVGQMERPQLSDQLRRLYRAVLHRRPSDEDLLYWSRGRGAGASLAWIADQLIGSPEFQQRNGAPSDEELVALLIDNMVSYDDPAEHLRRLAAGQSRGQIAASISEHPNAVWNCRQCSWPPWPESHRSWPSPPKAAQVWRLYQAYFLRSADQAGLDYWLDLYWNGASLGLISDYMSESTEFVRRYGALTDSEFVDRVYLNVLDRPADVKGKTYWTNQLGGGLTRGEMMLGFSDSPEFIRTTDTVPPAG